MSERELFEAFVMSDPEHPADSCQRQSDGEYLYTEVQAAWVAWERRANLSAPQPQPIESAPKDGTWIQVWVGLRGRWEIAQHVGNDIWEARDKNWCWASGELTHWLLLPPPPGTQPQGCPKCEEMRKALEKIREKASDWIVLDQDEMEDALCSIHSESEAALSTLKKQEEQPLTLKGGKQS